MSKPPDSITFSKVKSQSQSARRFSNDKIKTLTKQKLQEYIESFFNNAGVNFDLLSIISPRFINYNTDKSFDPQTDPTERKLQIARYFAELKNVLPSILIIDGGINVVPGNLGLIGKATTFNNNLWVGEYPIFRKIPLVILAASRDVEEADEMASVISLMFNELRNLAGGIHIHGNIEDGEKWVINLPQEPVDVGSPSDTEVPGDPIEKIWYTETSLEVYYEDTIAVQAKVPVACEGGFEVNKVDLRRSPGIIPVINVPDTLSINTQHKIVIYNWQDRYRAVLSDSTIATISMDFILTPRKFGTFKIMIIDPSKNDPFNTKNKFNHIITEKTITIV